QDALPPERRLLLLPVHARDPRRPPGQELRCEVPERCDDARPNQLDLAPEMALAGLDLLRYRIAVTRWTAFQHVGDVDLFARESDAGEQLLEQLPGGADERDSLLVLVKAGRLAHEHQIGMRLTRAE